MSKNEKLKEKLPEITFLGAISDFATLWATIILCGVFVYFGINQDNRQKKYAEIRENREKANTEIRENREKANTEIRENREKANTKSNQIEKKSEKEWNLWNKKNNTDFVFPFDFYVENNDFVINYNAEFNEDFSQINAKIEGFPLGEYNFPKFKIGQIVLKNVENRINDYFLINDNAIIKIMIIGTSDDTKVKPDTKYIGDLGDSIPIDYYNKDNTTKKLNKTIAKNDSITNTEYALLRAYSVLKHIQDNISNEIKKENIKIYIKLYKESGPEYRRCDFSVILENYFKYQSSDR